jgi:hypothetical protein
MRFSDYIKLVEGTTFTTHKGSSYIFSNGQTIRTKSLHAFHDPKDVGVKEQSELTVFVNPEFAREVGMWQTLSSNKKRLVLDNKKIYLLSLNPQTQQHGLDKVYSDSQYSLEPKIGLSPLELFKKDDTTWAWAKPGIRTFAGSHPGSPIISIT